MNKKKKKVVIIIILFLIFISIITLTLGKYTYNSVWNYYLSSKGFYFESDLLNINTKKNSILKWDGNNIYFTLKNGLNNKLITEDDISYKITCEVLGEESKYVDCILNNTSSNVSNGILSSNAVCINKVDDTDVSTLTKTACEVNGYTWLHEVTTLNNYFNLNLTDSTKEIDEVSVKLTVDSTSPYKKTLIGIFNLNKVYSDETNIKTNYQSFNEYDELTIINSSSEEKCFSITFDSNDYIFDLAEYSKIDYNVDSNEKVNQILIRANQNSSLIYNFYRINNEKIYSINDFDIEEKEC